MILLNRLLKTFDLDLNAIFLLMFIVMLKYFAFLKVVYLNLLITNF